MKGADNTHILEDRTYYRFLFLCQSEYHAWTVARKVQMTDVSTQHSIHINTLAFQLMFLEEEYFNLDLSFNFKIYNTK